MKPIYKFLLIALAILVVIQLLGILAVKNIKFEKTVEVTEHSPDQIKRTKELVEQIKLDHPDMAQEKVNLSAKRIRMAEEILTRREAQKVDPVDGGQ
jgi:Flp pilus assembly protein CpaB